MPEVQSEFMVADETSDYLWLQPKRGKNKNLQVPIPKESPEYDRRIREKLKELGERAEVTAVIVNENEENTAWRVRNIIDTDKRLKP